MLIEVKNLDFSFSEGASQKQVLSSINLNVSPGEIIILTGPSGSGKTTLLTLIGGLRTAYDGSIKVLGEELVGADYQTQVNVRRQIGFIFQAHNLLSFLNAEQNVAMSLQFEPNLKEQEIKVRARECLSELGLEQKFKSFPDSLSGGQKQRVAVARAIARKPKLILADEPTAALDSQSGRKVVSLMHDMAKRDGTAIILVTHDNRILDVADRIVNMEDGKMVKKNKMLDYTPCLK
ncbi:MAG: ATP-binding cassette domain-containing protein [Candidatus Melainabacteria bacterium]|nr:MAG: ATP-binding cassette domain-containing protein [Candidatus Melainabacteria bacterium]